MKLTKAQDDALDVLGTERYVRGGKRRSQREPVPQVNTTAALALCRLGLARLSLVPRRNVFTSGYDFHITNAGREYLLAKDRS